MIGLLIYAYVSKTLYKIKVFFFFLTNGGWGLAGSFNTKNPGFISKINLFPIFNASVECIAITRERERERERFHINNFQV